MGSRRTPKAPTTPGEAPSPARLLDVDLTSKSTRGEVCSLRCAYTGAVPRWSRLESRVVRFASAPSTEELRPTVQGRSLAFGIEPPPPGLSLQSDACTG